MGGRSGSSKSHSPAVAGEVQARRCSRALNARQVAFVEVYTNPYSKGFGNATQAAILAGYSRRTARQQGARLLTNADIQTAVAERQQKAADAARLSREEYIREAMMQAREWLDESGKPRKVPVTHEGKVVAEIERGLKMPNVKALELAGKAAGHLNEETTQAGQLNYVVIAPPMAETPEEWYERYKDQIAARTQGRAEIPAKIEGCPAWEQAQFEDGGPKSALSPR